MLKNLVFTCTILSISENNCKETPSPNLRLVTILYIIFVDFIKVRFSRISEQM